METRTPDRSRPARMRPVTGMIAAAMLLAAAAPSAWAHHDEKDEHAAATAKAAAKPAQTPAVTTVKTTTVTNPANAAAAKPAAATVTKPAAPTTVTKPAAATTVKTTTVTKPAGSAPDAQTNAPKTAAPKTKPVPVNTVNANSVAKASPGSRPAAKSAIVQSSAHLDEQVTYQYNALGRRDPFQSLLTGEYVGADVGGDVPPDVGGLKVVGIVWGDADQFALVEDGRGDSHILRRGDKVTNGYVEALKRDAMIVNLTVDGQSQSVTIPLTRKGEKINANH